VAIVFTFLYKKQSLLIKMVVLFLGMCKLKIQILFVDKHVCEYRRFKERNMNGFALYFIKYNVGKGRSGNG